MIQTAKVIRRLLGCPISQHDWETKFTPHVISGFCGLLFRADLVDEDTGDECISSAYSGEGAFHRYTNMKRIRCKSCGKKKEER